MKKNFLYSIVVLCICLFAACSQEEIMDEAGQQAGKQVSLTVGVPGGAMTRATGKPSLEGYKLRCIMQVVNESNVAIEGTDMRQVKEVTADKITFNFTAPEGDYKCLFWADFVPTANTDMKIDNIYTTDNLASITYKGNDAFGEKADAFCGYIAGGTTAITLKRPFAKVAVAPKNASSFASYNKLIVSYDAPNSFNMVTGAASGTKKVTYTNTAFDATSESSKKAWFTSFVFAPANVEKLASPITMTLSGGEGTPKTLTIPADKVPLTGNFEINGSFDVSESEGGGTDVEVDVDFNGGFDKPEVKAPIVGDYFYADGTWGAAKSNTSGAAAVGVIFHIENEEEPLDAATNYTGITFTDNKVHGWVVALTTASKKTWFEGEVLTAPIEGIAAQKGATDVLGFANSQILKKENGKVYPANVSCMSWSAVIPSTGTSGWYMPAIKQLMTLHANAATVDAALANIDETTPIMAADASMLLWANTFFDDGKPANAGKIYQLAFQTEVEIKAKSAVSTSSASVRAILTF